MSKTEEELRRRKLEEALEVKSLRRIIRAYHNYPEAAEGDVRRYKRCFRKLPPAQKALLPHIPFKFQKLRWCISQNSYFILEMLKAFEPPIDLNQDIENSEDHNMDNTSDNWLLSDTMKLPSQSGLKSGNPHSGAELGYGKGDNEEYTAQNRKIVTEEKKIESSNKNSGNCSIGFQYKTNAETSDNQRLSSMLDCDGHASSSPPDWLGPSLQFHVPLVDVNKVRCIIRNIVRDWAAEGQRERDECYKPILNELQRLFPHRSKESTITVHIALRWWCIVLVNTEKLLCFTSPPACLVPGAGLGRFYMPRE